jgi:hypothetical protein
MTSRLHRITFMRMTVGQLEQLARGKRGRHLLISILLLRNNPTVQERWLIRLKSQVPQLFFGFLDMRLQARADIAPLLNPERRRFSALN